MTDDTTTECDRARQQKSRWQSRGSSRADSLSISPSSSLTVGDPVRRGIGDEPADVPYGFNPMHLHQAARGTFSGSARKSDGNVGEGRKGPHADATRMSLDTRLAEPATEPSKKGN